MRIESKLVFNEFLSSTTPQYTHAELNEFLGRYDQISIQAVVDQVQTGGTLTVQMEHCADGRNFVDKGSAQVSGGFVPNATVPLTGIDQGLLPSLGFVRLRISISLGSAAHVKIHVTMRDQSGAAPATLDPATEAAIGVAQTARRKLNFG